MIWRAALMGVAVGALIVVLTSRGCFLALPW